MIASRFALPTSSPTTGACGRGFLEFVERSPETYPLPVSHCQICDWRAVCEQRWIDDDHLSLVASMRRSWIAKLGEAGITTLEGLALAQEEAINAIRPGHPGRIRSRR